MKAFHDLNTHGYTPAEMNLMNVAYERIVKVRVNPENEEIASQESKNIKNAILDLVNGGIVDENEIVNLVLRGGHMPTNANMQTIKLIWHKTPEPDFSELGYFLECRERFDVVDFVDVYSLEDSLFSSKEIFELQAATNALKKGEWLEVAYEII